MYIFIMLMLISISEGDDYVSDPAKLYCNGMLFLGKYYNSFKLFSDYGNAHNLVMHSPSGELFFSHSRRDEHYVNREIKACNVETSICRNITGISGGSSVYYDSKNDKIYFGGQDGIYRYSFVKKTAKLVGAKGKSIWSLFIINNLFYYVEYPSYKLYVIRNYVEGKPRLAVDKEFDIFYITKQIVVYYTNKNGHLYKVEKPVTPKKEGVILNDRTMVRQITEDFYGNVYFCTNKGIYIDEEPFRRIKRIAKLGNLYGLAVISSDIKENLILFYSNNDGIYIFYPSKYSKYCLSLLPPDEATVFTTMDPITRPIQRIAFTIDLDYDKSSANG